MTQQTSLLRRALGLTSIWLVLQQLTLALIVFLLSIVWLRVPDSTVFFFTGTIILGLIILALACSGEAWIALRVTGQKATLRRLLLGALFFLIGAAIWHLWGMWIEHLGIKDELRADYLHSRLPHSLRYFFTSERILNLEHWCWTILQWTGTGVIAALAFAAITSQRPHAAALRILRSITFWIALIAASYLAPLVTNSLMEWTPGQGLRIELASLASRLIAAVLFDTVLICFLLALLAALVRETLPDYAAPDGTPEDSQPRTVENP